MIKVGIALSLSGRFAAQGNQAQQGLLLWAEDVNNAGGLFVRDHGGKEPVELAIHDDESRREPAAARAEELIVQDRADILVGPYSSALTLAVAPVAERYRKVMWNHGGSSDAILRGGFRFAVSIPSPASRYFVGILEMVKALDPASSDEANRALAATSEALGECATGEEARTLADQLPKEIKEQLHRARTPKSARWRPSCGVSAGKRA